ncbi:hypothetical protein [Anabaena sp. AL09]|jgi:hypothetical protein|uniref:hypothetical protein n=1 Tax=Anabaena sp. AL09 TaxID=1710891 RepID=UPI000801BFE5|nr:hypothetical protein [Anabaena sp. AL09]MBJ7298608.1 hypothetical protein [Dolichospermum sp.]OBQ07582.1 MAG: hypothetical protein AN490_11515 [Anabaena sp. AL09]
MATIIISDLQEKPFLYELNSEEIQKISGTGIIPLPFLNGPVSDVIFSTIYDGINSLQANYEDPFGFRDNKLFALDIGRSNYYLVV